MIEKVCDIAVIGGGPAGLSSTITAALSGASVIMVNDSHSLGGNYYKSLPGNFEGYLSKGDQKTRTEYHSRIQGLESCGAQVIDQARVWGVFSEDDRTHKDQEIVAGSRKRDFFRICAEHPTEDSVAIQAQSLILAPGVYDRSLPFPGWELPGVVTPGAVQMMIKKQGLLPGKRVLVCGTGPLQILVAATLVEAGAEVVALCDTSGALAGLGRMPGAFGGLQSRFGEVIHSLSILVKKQVPLLFRQTVFQALGDLQTGVDGAVIGKITPGGSPIPGTQRTLSVDTICCSFGFMPSIELTLHLGCDHVYDPNLCAYIPQHDEHMRTSQPGVFVAGDVTGVGGKPLADLQGTTAAISALEHTGFLTAENAAERRKGLKKEIIREERFSSWLWNRYRIKGGLLELVEDDTVICRCEHVTAADLRQSLDLGAQELYGVKLRTRLGMGSCQGRYCMVNAAMLISRQTGSPVEDLGFYSVRPPLTPTRLKSIAALDPVD